ALVQLAAVSEQLKDGEGAIALYRRIPAGSPLKELSDLQLGLNLADLDRHEEAITHLKAFVDAHPNDMRAYLALGGVYSSKEDFRSAATLYDKAVEALKTPTAANWNIFYQRGIAYERLKEWPKAEPNFRKALELFPDQPQVLNYLGYSWVDMNMNLKEGLAMIQKAVDLRPSDGYIVDSLGWAYFRLGRFDDAVREMERAVSLKPEDPVLNDHLGDAYWRVGRKLEATFQWNQARDLKPDPDVLANLQQKLMKGLPPIESNTAQETPKVKPEPVPAPKG
ncbi:tetratricopeptide repeat protein, partial [Mesorhizobium sp. M7A.F.Ca.CA.002.15.2.1]